MIWHLSDELVLSKHNAEFTSIERRLLRTLVHSVTNKAFDDIVSEYEFPSKDNSSQTKTVLPTDITQKENTIHRWYSIIESTESINNKLGPHAKFKAKSN